MTQTSLTLYFGLKSGEKADLEIIAYAAIEWVGALRAAAKELDPYSPLRVEIIDAEESSLRINTILAWAESRLAEIQEGSGQYPRLRSLALALIVFIPTVGYPTYDFYFGDHTTHLSDEDRKRLDELIEKLQDNQEVAEKKQRFFQTVEKDRSIIEVGVSEKPKQKPIVSVPRSEFAERGGLWSVIEVPEERTLYPVVEVELIGPILLPKPRAWKFRNVTGEEFTAIMRDERFLQALRNHGVQERLRVGIPMTLRLKLEEKNDEGVWMLKKGGRSVVEVISPKVD